MIAPSIRVTRGPGMHITDHRYRQIMHRFLDPDMIQYDLPHTYTATQERVWKPDLPIEVVRTLLEMGIVPLTDHLEEL